MLELLEELLLIAREEFKLLFIYYATVRQTFNSNLLHDDGAVGILRELSWFTDDRWLCRFESCLFIHLLYLY